MPKEKAEKSVPKPCVCGRGGITVNTRAGNMITCPNPCKCPGGLRTRLMKIEDILGEDYNLEHLRELVEAECRWIPVTERMPESDNQVLAIVSGRWKNVTFDHAYELASWSAEEGWIMEAWPELENPEVTHWRPLPEPPKEGL